VPSYNLAVSDLVRGDLNSLFPDKATEEGKVMLNTCTWKEKISKKVYGPVTQQGSQGNQNLPRDEEIT
jgi:hypothetical protein